MEYFIVLVWLVVIALAAAFAYWAMNYWQTPESIKKVLVFALVVVVVIAVVVLLLGLVGGLPDLPRRR
jgi:uncharacterized membrane protein